MPRPTLDKGAFFCLLLAYGYELAKTNYVSKNHTSFSEPLQRILSDFISCLCCYTPNALKRHTAHCSSSESVPPYQLPFVYGVAKHDPIFFRRKSRRKHTHTSPRPKLALYRHTLLKPSRTSYSKPYNALYHPHTTEGIVEAHSTLNKRSGKRCVSSHDTPTKKGATIFSRSRFIMLLSVSALPFP